MIAEDRIVLPPAEKLRQSIAADPGPSAGRGQGRSAVDDGDLRPGPGSDAHAAPLQVLFGALLRLSARVPFTVHPGIGYDIIVNHPMYHGGAIGRAAGHDARVFAASVDRLEGGVHVSIGSAIMSPQVFEKAFSAANGIRVKRRPERFWAAIIWSSWTFRTAAVGTGAAASRPARIPPTTCASARASTAWEARSTISVATIGLSWCSCCDCWALICGRRPRNPQ